tara:strand:- start:1727 stop:2383 length:657 start_codon:yes stop_codon:yes gene_type:complete
MKKLFLLPILFLLHSCQNYDDQFDDLNSQIAALSSQVAGLSQVQSDLASLAGTVSSLQSTVASTATAIDGLDGLAENVAAIQESIADVATSEEVSAISDEVDAAEDDLADLLAISSFLKIHNNTAWKMIEETFTEYTLFYNSDESFIKVYDFSCNDSLQSNKITDLDTALVVDLNSNTVTFQYFADGEYMVRTEGTYRDTLYRVESTADALWSELGCD